MTLTCETAMTLYTDRRLMLERSIRILFHARHLRPEARFECRRAIGALRLARTVKGS